MAEALPLPDAIPDGGILIGWSLEHEHKKLPIGFRYSEHWQQKPPKYLEPILYEGAGHLLSIAPTGAGKGTGCIVPALLRYPGPVIVIDPKGENYHVTARKRREMGQKVIALDPFGLCPDVDRATLSPLDLLAAGNPFRVDDAAVLAELIVPKIPDNRDPFWDDRARQLILGLMLHVTDTRPPILNNLSEIRYLLNQKKEDLEFTAKEMLRSENTEVKITASLLQTGADKTIAGILTTAQSKLDFIRGDAIQGATNFSSFSIDDVTRGEPLSIYLVIPPDKLESHSQILRLWIGMLMTAIMRRRRAPEKPTLFVLDEAAQLGPLPQLRTAITLLRGYGLQTWSFWQDLSQLQRLYQADWESILNNAKVLQVFGIPNMRAAHQARELTGYNNVDQLVDLDADEVLLAVSGDEAVIAQRPNYLTDPIFTGQHDQNPYHLPHDQLDIMPRYPQRKFLRKTFLSADEIATKTITK